MPTESPSGGRIAENPLISKILANGGATATVLWGYIGPSPREGHIALHTSLRNLAISVEIAERDIIHIADVPESIFPFGAKAIWVKKEAPIVHRLAESADAVKGDSAKSGSVEVAKGRLRMRVANRRAAAGCTSDCVSPCSTCSSPCSVCQSICRVDPE